MKLKPVDTDYYNSLDTHLSKLIKKSVTPGLAKELPEGMAIREESYADFSASIANAKVKLAIDSRISNIFNTDSNNNIALNANGVPQFKWFYVIKNLGKVLAFLAALIKFFVAFYEENYQ